MLVKRDAAVGVGDLHAAQVVLVRDALGVQRVAALAVAVPDVDGDALERHSAVREVGDRQLERHRHALGGAAGRRRSSTGCRCARCRSARGRPGPLDPSPGYGPAVSSGISPDAAAADDEDDEGRSRGAGAGAAGRETDRRRADAEEAAAAAAGSAACRRRSPAPGRRAPRPAGAGHGPRRSGSSRRRVSTEELPSFLNRSCESAARGCELTRGVRRASVAPHGG